MPHQDRASDVRPAVSPPEKSGLGKTIARLFMLGINLCLLATLGMAAILHLCDSYTVPAFLVEKVNARLADHGIRVEAKSIELHFPSSLVATNVRIYIDEHSSPLASFEVAELDLDPGALLRREFEPRKIRFAGGRLNCPAEISPSGITEGIIERAHLHLEPEIPSWRIVSSAGRIHNSYLSIEGLLPRPDPVKEPVDFRELPRILAEAVRWKQFLHTAEQLQLNLKLVPDGKSVAVRFEAGFENWNNADWPKISKAGLAGSMTFDEMGPRIDAGSLSLETARWQDWEARGLVADFTWNGAFEFSPDAFPLADIRVDTIITPFGPLEGVRATAKPDGEQTSRTHIYFRRGDEFVRSHALLDWENMGVTADIIARINPNFVLRHSRAVEMGFRRDVFFHRPVMAHALVEADLADGLTLATAHVVSGPAEIDGVSLSRADVFARFEPGLFDVSELNLAYDDFEVAGSYRTNLLTRDYRFTFEGALRPMHIAPWFRNWWDNLWNDFVIKDPIRGDILLTGAWGGRTMLAGWVTGDYLSFRNVPLDRVGGNLFIDDDYFDIYDALLERAEGDVRGDAAFRLDRESRKPVQWQIDLLSSVDPAQTSAAAAPWGPEIFDSFEFDNPPTIRLSGGTGIEDSRPVLQFAGECNTPLRYHGIALDHLSLHGLLEGDDLTLESFRFGLGGGSGQGNARIWHENGAEQLSFQLALEDAAFDPVAGLLKNLETERMNTNVNGNLPALRGTVGLNVAATGKRDDPHSFAGTGDFKIIEADFGQIHLFGPLSRLFSAIPLPLGFSSLQLDRAESSFSLEPGRVWLPDLKLQGPTATVEANGAYRISQDELDFAVRVYLMRQSRVPLLSLVLAPVAHPLAHMTEIRLTGSLEDPEWRFVLGPRGIWQSLTPASPQP